MYHKYIKYKSKYLNLKGGAPNDPDNPDLPILIYTIGQETKLNMTRAYICTLLYQIKLFRELSGITYSRVFIIYGNNITDTHTCDHVNAGEMANLPIPYGVDIYYIDKYSTINSVRDIYESILNKHTTIHTPIIYIYDGHGYTDQGCSNGNMELFTNLYLNKKIILDDITFSNLFNIPNNKLFLFTQCGSFDFQKRLESSILNNYTSICSTKSFNACGYGAKILLEISKLLKKDTKYKFKYFIDMKHKLTDYYIYDSNIMAIKSIMPYYQKIQLNTTDTVLLYIPKNNIYCSNNILFNKKVQPTEEVQTWQLENIDEQKYIIKTTTILGNTTHHGILEINDTHSHLYMQNSNNPPNTRQHFIIHYDLTLSPASNSLEFIFYNGVEYYKSSEDKPLIEKLRIIKYIQ
jgi:hypothetical protein